MPQVASGPEGISSGQNWTRRGPLDPRPAARLDAAPPPEPETVDLRRGGVECSFSSRSGRADRSTIADRDGLSQDGAARDSEQQPERDVGNGLQDEPTVGVGLGLS